MKVAAAVSLVAGIFCWLTDEGVVGMGKETRIFKSEERLRRSEVSQFLRQVADKIENGQVVLRQGQEELTLAIPRNLILEVQVEEMKRQKAYNTASKSS